MVLLIERYKNTKTGLLRQSRFFVLKMFENA